MRRTTCSRPRSIGCVCVGCVGLRWVGPRATRCAAWLTCCHPSGCDGCSGGAGVGVPPIASAVRHAAVHLRENHEPIAQAPPAVTPWPRPWRLRPVVGRTGPVVPCHRRRSAQPQGSRTQPCRAPPLCRIATQRQAQERRHSAVPVRSQAIWGWASGQPVQELAARVALFGAGGVLWRCRGEVLFLSAAA